MRDRLPFPGCLPTPVGALRTALPLVAAGPCDASEGKLSVPFPVAPPDGSAPEDTRMASPRPRFNVVEVLTILALVIVLAWLVLTARFSVSTSTGVADCRANLSQLHKQVLLYSTTYGDYLPSFWHERWVREMGFAGPICDRDDSQADGEPDTLLPDPRLVCPSDQENFVCPQGCRVSYMGLAKYGWWDRSRDVQGNMITRFKYHRLKEFSYTSERILFCESVPAAWQAAARDDRRPMSGHPSDVLDRHRSGGHILFFDGHIELVRDEKRSIRFWEPDFEETNPGQ